LWASLSPSYPHCVLTHHILVACLTISLSLLPVSLSLSGEGFDQSPIRRSFKSKVLVHYPENHPHLCSYAREPLFHSFTITADDGTRTYGFVHTFYERVTNPRITTAMQTLFQMHRVEHQASSSASSPSSSYGSSPSACSMESLLSSLDGSDADSLAGGGGGSPCPGCTASFDPASDTLYGSKALCLLMPLPFLQAARNFLSQLYQAVMSPAAPPLPLESYIHNVLYEVPLPPPGRSLRFHGVQGPIVCQQPDATDLPLGEYPLGDAFALLGVDNVVRLLTCVLLEMQVLLYSRDLQCLMTVAEGITCLLFPFQWQHIYLPILPGPLLHLLDAPVPFLMGLQRRDGVQRSSLNLPHEATLCFVDIDNRSLEVPEGLPSFPDQDQLAQELREVLLRYGVTSQPASSPPPPASPSPRPPASLVLEDLIEDRQNGNLGGEELAVLERLQALACRGRCLTGPLEDREQKELRSAKMNVELREVVAGRLAAVFGRYEEFVSHSASDLDSWLSNPEGTCSFHKGSFLSIQPVSHLHFLSRFLETSMFLAFVDRKLISRWVDSEPLQRLFDQRLERGRGVPQGPPGCQKGPALFEPVQTGEQRLLKTDHTAIHPHLLDMRIGQGLHQPGFFPTLQADVLSRHAPNNLMYDSMPVTDHVSALQKCSFRRRNLCYSRLLDPSPSAVTQTHREFVYGLLNECRLKTKRLLVERIGKESLEAGGPGDLSGLQEGTLIQGLCDLLERTWGHGLTLKQGPSTLWSHLLHYQAVRGKSDSPARPSGVCGGHVITVLVFVQRMSEGLSEVALVRAWIHLALEKKLLSKHLKELLSDQELLRQLYRPHAFLLCGEEREQFLFHLLSLNAVDYLCFTRVFTAISIPYRVVIIPMKKLSIAMTTVNPWVCVSGELGNSGVRQIPKNTQEIFFQCQNLGRLSTLQLGQDSGGLLAKCFIECVVVYNEVTGHTYKFPCGRWLGKGVGDGSLERVLIGQLVSPGAEEDSGKLSGTTPAELGSPPQAVQAVLGSLGGRSSTYPESRARVQEEMREAANNLVKHFHKPEQERENLTVLLCGEGGLVQALHKFFLHGLRSNRLFQRNVFVWDFVEKAVVSMDTVDQTDDLPGSESQRMPADSLCHYVHAINDSPRNMGKEGKFQLFLCLGVRDGLISRWLPLLAESPLTPRTFEESACSGTAVLWTPSRGVVHTLHGFTVTLEASLVRGVTL
uniref:DENN domain-containing protein 5B-like n=2 Tax=Gadus morhua TaxID=8049 RepID=A0A8C5D1P8_GADMO